MRPLVTFSLLACLALPLGACSEGKTADVPKAERRAVVVAPVHYRARTPERSFVGSVRPRIEADLGFRVAGKIAERLVQSGEVVKAGQPLARLDPTDFVLQKQQADAEYTAAKESLAQNEAQSQRNEVLKRNGWVTQATVDAQNTATAEARGRLDRASRARDLAANQLAYSVLAADSDGVITATLGEPGQVVAAGTLVMRLARAGEREAVIAVPEALVEQVRGGTASVSLWSAPGKRYQATLREFSASADAATRTFPARFTIRDADEAVIIGLTATVTIAEPETTKVARLPISALFDQGSGPSLWIVNRDTGALTLKPVKLAGYDGGDVLLAGGVDENELAVALGVQKLDAAQQVRIVETRG